MSLPVQQHLAARPGHAVERGAHHLVRRNGIARAGQCEERQQHTGGAGLSAAECRDGLHTEVRHVANGGPYARVVRHQPVTVEMERIVGKARSTQQHQRLAALADAEPADACRVDAAAPVRMREQHVERRRRRQRPQRLHGDEFAPDRHVDLGRRTLRIGPEHRVTQVAMERRDRHVAPRGQRDHRGEIGVVQRAARIAVRCQDDRQPCGIGRQDRRLGAALHVRHDTTVGQRVIGPRVGGGGRIARDEHVIDGGSRPSIVEVGVRGRDERLRQRIRWCHEQVVDVALLAVTRDAPPVHVGRLACADAREVLLDVRAADRMRAPRR